MEVFIKGTAEEIAALVLKIQGQRRVDESISANICQPDHACSAACAATPAHYEG